MITLIRNAAVLAPKDIGRNDVLIAGDSVVEVGRDIEITGANVNEIDADGLTLVPGIVDALTHPAGGGGEGGFGQRTAELTAADFIAAGVTTPVGALGTDAITRSLDVLYGHVMALRAAGLAAYMYSGSYQVPAPTLTGDAARDLVMIDPVIGFGEIAIADHRSSQPTALELRKLAAQSQLGGTLSGKGGTVMLHVGDGAERLSLMRDALADTELPAACFYPTHANRSESLLLEAFEHARAGGWIDFTASTTPEFLADGEIAVLDALAMAERNRVPPQQLTLSSDAGGSLPEYRDQQFLRSRAASPDVLLSALLDVADDAAMRDLVLPAITTNPARALKLYRRGEITENAFADLLLIDVSQRQLKAVMCNGAWLQAPEL
ncbi:MAG: beta-aspartyl-peptidase [Halieaceae bacterium]|nr:beta-aspartyl-peptidase [Halieaceae bacterium]